MNLVPVTLLFVVLIAAFKLVQSEPLSDELPGEQLSSLQTPVTTQSMVIEAKSTAPVTTGADGGEDEDVVWKDISNAISNLNELVGAEMFLELKRAQKGQMEVRLDKGFWDRVQYQTRVDLKTDISDLWHLYATEYKNVDSSVVYFIDDTNGKVIDIFSKAK